MALSFNDSLKNKQKELKENTNVVSTFTMDEPTPVVSSIVFADNNDEFTVSEKYLWYSDYSDNDFSEVDSSKNINVSQNQINLTQESNSQFIPFRMNRFYDGMDLMKMTLLIHFVTAQKFENNASPINVQYSSDKITFGWLVSKEATAHAGDLTFEIQAIGVNSKGDEYIWKTKPNGKLNILESLSGDGVIEPDESWITSFLQQVTDKVSEASQAANEAKEAATQASQSATEVTKLVNDSKNELVLTVDDKITEKLNSYYTSTQVDELLADIDLSDVYEKIDNIDGLAKFNVEYNNTSSTISFYNGDNKIKDIVLNTNPSAEWVTAYNQTVDNKISTATAPITEDLNNYKKSNDETVSALNDKIGDLPETLKTKYYDKDATDLLLNEKASSTDVSALSTKIDSTTQLVNTNKTSITTIGTKVSSLEDAIGKIDVEPGKTYEATYNEEGIYTLYEIENEGQDNESRTVKSQFKLVGGSGGGGTSSTLKIEYITKSPLVVTANDKAIIKYNFSGQDSSGDEVTEGNYTWKIGNRVIATGIATSGENSFDASDFISLGSQKLTLTISDDAGSVVVKSWTVQKVDIRLESGFNDTLTYPLEDVSFDYTPYGAISKTIHFKLDGKELQSVTTTSSGIPMAYNLSAQSHGSHLLELWISANINNSTVESNHIFKDIIWYDSTSNTPVIGCISNNITVKQYDTENIVYTVYDPKTETPNVELAIDGRVISNLQLDYNTQTWQYKPTDVGNHILTIKCGETVKAINVTVEKLDIDIEPVIAGLQFDFNPIGKSNNDTNRLWVNENNNDIKMTVSDNFDWENGGYQIDENGEQYFGVKAGTTATISYNLFADDARRNGKEFKFIFKTENVANASATFLSCESNGIGLQMNVHEAYIKSSAKSLYIPYSEEDIIEWEFNINKNSDIPLVMSYEDGTPCRPMSYTSDYSFTQDDVVPITIGSPDCDVRIYRMKAYNTSLSTKAILSNFIADARTATEMIDRYKRNQIYDENQMLTPETLADACPNMRIIKIESPIFTNDKKNYIKNASMECIYKNGDATLDNWKIENGYVVGQGTTSNEYGQAGRNLDFIFCADGIHQINNKIPLDTEYKSKITFGDGSVIDDGTGKISLTRGSVPMNWMNFKVNIASSEMVNNAYLQKRYNDYLPYTSPAQRRDSKVKNDMEFVNCVIFIKESDSDISTHREFQDNEWHYYALGNMGDSKKTDITRAYDPDDMKEFCIEVSDNTLANSIFQTGIKNTDGTMKYPISKAEWVSGNTAYDALYNDWDGSFEFRYDCCGDSKDGSATSTDEIKEQIRTNNRQIWRDFYEFVITSTNDEFVNNLKNWCIVDSALYFYLFTLRYTMIDNRAKNTFWHWAKHYISTSESEELGDNAKYYTIDDEAAKINNGYRFDLWNYDNDSSLGINNSGELTMTYGKEDTDYRTDGNKSSGYIFNAADSVFWCRIRDLMKSHLRTMYATCESKGCWSATSLINQFDEKQNEWCEELWRLDYERKYERTYRDGNTRFLEQMMNGKKKYQRRQFERDQEMYMATKFLGTTATSNQIMFRCNTPVEATVKPDYTLHLTPYSDMYLSVMFGNSSPTQVRAKAGKQYDIICPYETMDDTAVLIYGASRIQSMGDVSTCYIHDNDFSKAEKLKELIIGNTTSGYSNTFLTNLVIGNNVLLEKLDVRNTPNLSSSLNLSKCGNLKELYATGSGLTGVLFANGGKIQTALLPSTLTSINMRNLKYLTNLSIVGYEQITTMVVENCSTIDVAELLEKCPKVNRVRIIGVDWQLDDTSLLDRLYNMTGIDKNGYNTDTPVLTGKVHVPVMKEKKLAEYKKVWTDLEITYNTLVEQFTIKFVNDNGSTLDIQYVDKGEYPEDPVTRGNNPIKPIKESSVQYDYTFDKWDSNLVVAFGDKTYTATYTSSLRKYHIRYLVKGVVKQESDALYGDTVFYTGDTPTYTAEESAYKYYLFKEWDSSGRVTGNKDINAIFDSCEYVQDYFKDKELSTMRPVEIYALTKLGKESEVVSVKDSISFEMGTDYSFDDVTEHVLISKETAFTGNNYIDTKISLFDEDKDFVLAMDYKFNVGNQSGSTLAQCYKSDGSLGFKISYGSQLQISWNTTNKYVTSTDKRDILVLRHIKGEKLLHIYRGNLPEETIEYSTLESAKSAITNSTIVFGCSKADDGAYENYAKGIIYWAKLWDTDLGDSACRNLASWTHESIELEMYGFKRYYLSDNSGSRSSMSFMCSHVLDNSMMLNKSSSNAGGWGEMSLNAFLNNRFYNAIPAQWKQLIKQVKIPFSLGEKSTEIGTSNCYIAIPSVIEVESSMNFEPYNYEGSVIPFITSDETRVRKTKDGVASSYWLRSPNVSYNTYTWSVNSEGSTNGYRYGTQELNIVIILSI